MGIRVKVPATSANLGPGYDSMGLSFDLYNEFCFEEAGETNTEKDNLILYSFQKLYERANKTVPPLHITCTGEVPIARGLGSSATCIIGGLLGANKMLDHFFSMEQILELATEIEGHPDNVAPALFGGLVISTMEQGKVYFYRTEVSKKLKYYAIIPDFEVKTADARAVVPQKISLQDGIYNVARSNLMSRALERGDMEMLYHVAGDKFHEPYRKHLIYGMDIFEKIAREQDAVCLLSGAGSTMLVIAQEDNGKILPALRAHGIRQYHYEVKELTPQGGAAYL